MEFKGIPKMVDCNLLVEKEAWDEVAGTLTIDEKRYEILFSRSIKAQKFGHFLVTSITDVTDDQNNGKKLFRFDRNRDEGFCRLFYVNLLKQYVLGFIKNNELIRVLTWDDMQHGRSIKAGDKTVLVGGTKPFERGRLKTALYFQEKEVEKFKTVVLTEEESMARDLYQKMANEAKKAAIAENEKAKAAKEARRNAIYARDRLYVYDKEGRSKNGIPVVEEEVELLRFDTYAIIVESFDKEENPVNPKKALVVTKKKGNREILILADDVSLERPRKGQSHEFEAIGLENFLIDGEVEAAVPVFARTKGIVLELTKIFNHGILVAIPLKKEGFYQLFRMDGEEPTAVKEPTGIDEYQPFKPGE